MAQLDRHRPAGQHQGRGALDFGEGRTVRGDDIGVGVGVLLGVDLRRADEGGEAEQGRSDHSAAREPDCPTAPNGEQCGGEADQQTGVRWQSIALEPEHLREENPVEEDQCSERKK